MRSQPIDHGDRFPLYDHDRRGRLIRERRPDAVVDRAMDAVGNVYRTADGRDRRYGQGGRLEMADGVRYEHDEDGNQTLKSGPDGDWHYRWNGHSMLREVERPDGVRVQFEYDPFARRTAKRIVTPDATPAREVQFVWDGHTVVHELDSERGLISWQWEPESFTPIAKEHDGRRWTIASDHDTRAAGAPLVPGEAYEVDVGAPASAQAVIASLAVIPGGDVGGFLTAFPCGAPLPPTSNLNFSASAVAAGTVISPLSAGRVCFVSSVAAHLVVDVTGFLVPEGELSYQPIEPLRVLDTRQPDARYLGRVGAGQVLELPLGSLDGMPAEARAVFVNLTATDAEGGFAAVYPCGVSVPATSSLNVAPGVTTAALVLSNLGAGSLCLYSTFRTHFVIDLLGAWVPTPGAPPPSEMPPPGEEVPEDEPPDATQDAGVTPPDGAVRQDAATAGPGTGGGSCACAVAPRPELPVGLVPMLAALGAVLRRRARRARG